jgi:hypothetical protein
MTTILVDVHDDTKVEDVFRFLKDIDFLDVRIESPTTPKRRQPAPDLAGTAIIGDIESPVIPLSDWEALR